MRWQWILLGALFIAGCETPDPLANLQDPREFVERDYRFLEIGQISREEVLMRLGPPAAKFEGDRIFAYQIVPILPEGSWGLNAPKLDYTTGLRTWDDYTCSLILVFDATGLLERKSLVLPYGIGEKVE